MPTIEIIEAARKKFKSLHFFVLKRKFDLSAQIIEAELENLNKYGEVFIYDQSQEGTDRADALRKYIASWLH